MFTRRMRLSTLSLLAAAASAASTSPIKYIIVLMMENRSFDHMLGHLGLTDSRIDGLQHNQSNPVNTSDPNSGTVFVQFDAIDGGPVDPHHDFDSITQQIFGFAKGMNESAPVRMDGFVANSLSLGAVAPDFVMSAFNDSTLPVLSTLARQYAVFDHWHCSCPCPTNPNREFLMSGTAHGMTVNTIPDAGFPQQTHFTFLGQRNISWGVYYHDDPWMAPAFADLRTPESLARIQEAPAFFSALANGTLPRFSLIQPRMASSATGPSNWQHPDNSVAAGEQLIANVYNSLRESVYWNESLLVITYDEHGGFFDHQATPTQGVPAPDDVIGDNGFLYDRLGVRIPTVMISPWVAAGTVVNAPSPSQQPTPTSWWDATSIIASANRIFGIGENLTRRDAWAATFVDLVDGSSGLRTDSPRLPPVPSLTPEELAAEMAQPLNDHHLDSLNLLCALTEQGHPVCSGYGSTAERLAEQQAFAEGLGPRHTLPASWAHAAAYPHLWVPAATALRQEHFEAVSKAMWTSYKARVLAGAPGGPIEASAL